MAHRCWLFFLITCLGYFPCLATISTTPNHEAYFNLEVFSVTATSITLSDGSVWLFEDEPAFHPGEWITLYDGKGSSPKDLVWVLANPSNGHSLSARVDPTTITHHIKRKQALYWCGEVQYLLTLEDDSLWLFDEFSTPGIYTWKVGDFLLFTDYPYNLESKHAFCLAYNLSRQGAAGRVVFYTIWDDYLLEER